jgi:hypothetical protein
MIGMGAKSITIVRAVTADFFFDCRAAEVRKLSILYMIYLKMAYV